MASNPTGLSPSTIASGLQLWLDANDPYANGTLPANNTVITTWSDKSGLGNNITGINSPRWYASPSRMSNSANAYFTGANPTSYNMTAFFVYLDANSPQACAPVYTANDPAVTDTTGLFPNCGGTTFVQTSGGWATQTATITDTTSNLLSLQYSSASNTNNVFIFFNGTLNMTTSSSPFTRTSYTLGRRVNEYMTGNYYECLFYNTILTTNERQQVEGYLAWKWGLQGNLPATHPYRINPFLITTETVPRFIPSSAFLIPVNTYSTVKTLTLPSVSTNPGRVLILKDYLGYAGSNNIRLSTTGIDTIERSNVSSMTLSNSFGAWWFQNDGISRWFLTSAYLNSLPIIAPTPPYSNYLWSQFRNMTSSAPSITPGGSGWGAAIGTPSNYNPINYQDGDSRIGQSDQVGIVCKGYFYSASNTTVQFRMIIDDGGVIFFNGSNVLQSWILQGDTTYTTGSLNVTAGYTPFQFNFYEWGGGMTCELYYSVAGGAFTADGTGRFFYDASSQIYP